MALDFTTSGSRVDCGSDTSVDNLCSTGLALTTSAWVYRTAGGTNQAIITKWNTGATGWAFLSDNITADGQIRLLVGRATTNTDFSSNSSNVLTADTWHFVAATFDDAASPKVKLYRGSLSTPVAEVSGYATTTAGTGALVADAGANLWVGNFQVSSSLVFKGRIARAGVVNRVLTLDDLRRIQYATVGQCNITGTKLLLDIHGTGTQPDLSGNLNNGAVTTASVAAHVPVLSVR